MLSKRAINVIIKHSMLLLAD